MDNKTLTQRVCTSAEEAKATASDSKESQIIIIWLCVCVTERMAVLLCMCEIVPVSTVYTIVPW